jgi:adenylate cyclase
VPTEIERKFLVRDASIVGDLPGTTIAQGYLSVDPERTVRVRRAGDRAFLTVKGLTIGAARPEFEYEIPPADVDELLALCGWQIDKTRYRLVHDGLTWEVDVFGGRLAGLVLAEVEVPHAAHPVAIPSWVGAEVTTDERYFNSNLARFDVPALRDGRTA